MGNLAQPVAGYRRWSWLVRLSVTAVSVALGLVTLALPAQAEVRSSQPGAFTAVVSELVLIN